MSQSQTVCRPTHGTVRERRRAQTVPAQLGLVARKPVFGVSDKASFKPVSSAAETSQKIEISLVASLDMILLD